MQADEKLITAMFTAKQATVIKSSDAASQSLADDQKMPIDAKAQVTGVIASQSKTTFVVDGAALDGKALPAHLRYFHRPHWDMQPIEAPVVAPAAAAEPAAKPAPAAKAKVGSKDDEIRALLAEGKSVSFIAREVKVGRATIKRVRDGEAA